jgi:hypothetical protein
MPLKESAQLVIDEALRQDNPNWFTNFFIRPKSGGYLVYPESTRHAGYVQKLMSMGQMTATGKVIGKAEDINFVASSGGIRFNVHLEQLPTKEWAFFEERGYISLPWMLEFYKAEQEERVVIGVPGTGKTMGIGMLAMFMCATIPHFRFLNVAPTLYQSNLMVRTIEDMLYGTQFREEFIVHGKAGWVAKPYTKITFENGSTAEFMNVANNAVNIQSWYGDWINCDEAGLLNDLDESGTEQLANIMIGLATRLRGARPDGRPRLGWLSLISMAYDCDTLWERYEAGAKPKHRTIWSRLVLHTENPYLTKKDVARMQRNIPPGQEAQWMKGERPQKKGAEFGDALIRPLFNQKQWIDAVTHLNHGDEGWRINYSGPGVVQYEEPFQKDHAYVMAGDPGVGRASPMRRRGWLHSGGAMEVDRTCPSSTSSRNMRASTGYLLYTGATTPPAARKRWRNWRL